MTARLYRMYADAHEAGIRPNDKELEKDVKKLMDLYNRGGLSANARAENLCVPV